MNLYQILINLYQIDSINIKQLWENNIVCCVEIVSNFTEFVSKINKPVPNSHEFVSISNELVSNFNESVSIFNELRDIEEKKKLNGYFIKIISNCRHNTTQWNHHPWLENSSRNVRVLSCRVWTCFVVLTWIICCWSVDVDSILSVRTG